MIKILFFNGSFDGASLRGLSDFEQVKDATIEARCEGFPFRGTPMDMAKDAIAHILKRVSSEIGLFPVVLESNSGTDKQGDYTTRVVFQVVA